jgi:hypothetical protein
VRHLGHRLSRQTDQIDSIREWHPASVQTPARHPIFFETKNVCSGKMLRRQTTFMRAELPAIFDLAVLVEVPFVRNRCADWYYVCCAGLPHIPKHSNLQH